MDRMSTRNTTKPKKELICEHLKGYWINELAGTFRCYQCGCQFSVHEISHNPKRDIETWIGDDDDDEGVGDVLLCPSGEEIPKDLQPE